MPFNLPIFLTWLRILAISLSAIPFVFAAIWAWGGISALIAPLPLWGKLLLGAALVAAAVKAPTFFGKADVSAQPLNREEWHRIFAIAIIVFFVIFFWMGFEQAGGTMSLFADNQTDRHLFGYEFPASWFQAVNPLVIILFAPLYSALWKRR